MGLKCLILPNVNVFVNHDPLLLKSDTVSVHTNMTVYEGLRCCLSIWQFCSLTLKM